jgi:uncharacterized protein YbcV (DUF1398 family)
MDEDKKRVMHECSKGSLEDGLSFPDVVARLARIGCEQYHADFRRREKTYYMLDGQTYTDALLVGSQPIAETFAADRIVAALREIQAGRINYAEFLKRIIAAGCVGYLVCLTGNRAIYLGRNGETYVEQFPSASPAPGG